MSSRLHAFIGNKHVGVFERTGAATARFAYDDDHGDHLLSLSLPHDRHVDETRAFNYLDNLLPDNPNVRRRLAQATETTGDTFSLLSAVGEDVAGAVSLSETEDLPQRDLAPPVEATEDDVAYQINRLRHDSSAPPPDWVKPRWSLAGYQAKFSLARVAEKWYWSTFELPSTHIFKPATDRAQRADVAEVAMLQLASDIGLPSAEATTLQFKDQRTFVTTRWDRSDGRRLHAEDLAQSLGVSSSGKYSITAADIIAVLRPYGQEWAFVRQLAFNTVIGNSDAHGKNYSVLIGADNHVYVAPMYDTLPIILWPSIDQHPAMPIDGARNWGDITRVHWFGLARASGLDPDRMMAEVQPIITEVSQRLPDVMEAAGLGSDGVTKARKHARIMSRMFTDKRAD